jgi:DNA polymerase
LTVSLHLDWETRGVLDLRKVGLYNYARHPQTDIWLGGYAFGDEDPQVWFPGQPCPPRIAEHIQAGGPLYAWNAPFEIDIWQQIATPRYGWPELKVEQVFCVMAMSYAMALPGGLDDAAYALALPYRKDEEGYRLMLRMCRPRSKPGVTPIVWWDEPEKIQRLAQYCTQDVVVERAAHKRLTPLSEKERKVWLLDYAINCRGVAADIETAEAATKMIAKAEERAGEKLAELTGGKVASINALIPLKQWCREQDPGTDYESLDKEAVAGYLSDDTLPDNVRQALTIRGESGKSSVAKIKKILELAGSDGRLRNWVQYHGASTGRWAARGVQLHNMVRDMPPAKVVDEILQCVRDGKIEWLDMAYGSPLEMISKCSRSFFMAPKFRRLVVGDYSNVEGRGTAWISGEQWKLDAFRAADAGTGPGLYELAAGKILGKPASEIKNPSEERQIGKICELALGYQGGVGAIRRFLPNNMKGRPENELDSWKTGWRTGHPATVATWKALQRAAIMAVENKTKVYNAGYDGRHVSFCCSGDFLWCRLPSGRLLCYPYPKVLSNQYGPSLTYMTVPSVNDIGRIVDDPRNTSRWARIMTYGGSLMENVVQALCRDLLTDCMLLLDAAGWEIVLHVHDEIATETDEAVAEQRAQSMTQIMRIVPNWAREFPLWVGACHAAIRYGK